MRNQKGPACRQAGFAPLFLLIGILVLLAIVGGGYYYLSNLKQKYNNVLIINSSKPVATPLAESSSKNGTVSGKLCYPSEGIPAGMIVAKSLTSGKLYSQDYAGTIAGAGINYSFNLPADSYNLRLEIGASNFGYHTSVCPTGGETSCGDTSKRELISADLTKSETVTNFDLCDFYYQPATAPDF